MRALPLVDPADATGWTISDEYGLGPALLVAPVVEAGATKRSVHFPSGTWVPLEGGAAVTGPSEADVTAPMAELPVFARLGSVVPLLPDGVQTIFPAAPVDRVLWVYPGASGRFVERDGTTYTLTFDASVTDALPAACTSASQRGCLDGKTVRLAGPGPFKFPSHTLTISGGPARQVDVRLVE